jgi:hypothetical protein
VAAVGLREILEIIGAVEAQVPPAGAIRLDTLDVRHLADGVPLSGPLAGLVSAAAPFPARTDLLVVGSVDPALGQGAQLEVRVRADIADNPRLIGLVEVIVPLGSDGTFRCPLALFFRTDQPTPRSIDVDVTVVAGAAPIASQELHIELVDLEGFLAFLDARPGSWRPGLRFAAAARKVLLPSSLFDRMLAYDPPVLPLLALPAAVKNAPRPDGCEGCRGVSAVAPRAGDAVVRMRAYKALLAGTELVDISHVIVGMEGSARFDAPLQLPVPRRDLVLTWAGDLGSALQEWAWCRFYCRSRRSLPLIYYVDLLAPRAELLGDLDGVNLAATYDLAKSLTENLRSYYTEIAPRRFSAFLANTKQDDGALALEVEPAIDPPRLTAAAHAFLAARIVDFATLALVQAVLSTPRFASTVLEYPPGLAEVLDPGSPEVTSIVATFFEFLERGLAAEQA